MIIQADFINDLFKFMSFNDIKKFRNSDIVDFEDYDIEEYGIDSMEFISTLNTLEGYTCSLTQNGSHISDSQWVEYTLIFKRDNGVQTSVKTLMCLMNGFEYRGPNVEI